MITIHLTSAELASLQFALQLAIRDRVLLIDAGPNDADNRENRKTIRQFEKLVEKIVAANCDL